MIPMNSRGCVKRYRNGFILLMFGKSGVSPVKFYNKFDDAIHALAILRTWIAPTESEKNDPDYDELDWKEPNYESEAKATLRNWLPNVKIGAAKYSDGIFTGFSAGI